MAMDDAQFNRIAKALADPQRFAILQQIAAGGAQEVACQAVVAQFSLRPATISHHLKELTTAGLIEGRKTGQCVQLRSKPMVLSQYLREVARRTGLKQTTNRK